MSSQNRQSDTWLRLSALEIALVTCPQSVRTSIFKAALCVFATVLMAACGSAPEEAAQTDIPTTPLPDAAASQTTPVSSASPVKPALPTPNAARTATPSAAAAAASAVPAVTTTVSPSAAQTGSVTLSLSLEPARRMIADNTGVQDPPTPTNGNDQQPAALTALTLDGLLKVTNNLDPSQPAPADEPQSIMRHMNLQIRATDGGYPVPYLNVSMDILLDGRPVLNGISVVPMTAPDSATPQLLYYGNNVKFTQRGTYQFFVRMQPTSVLGTDPPPTAEFNVVMR
ncbi:MAG: iron transporter [Sinobacteraceae bacterium]|nr:iron transporter [Nevskiaceae bacterium]